MGMPIEKIIEIYNESDRIGGTILRGNSEEDTKYNSETIEALQSINIILSKYQKIKEIINNAKDSDGAIKYNWLYEQISGVMEDGTD